MHSTTPLSSPLVKLTATDLKAVLKKTASEVMDDDVLSLSAAIAYYTVFSLPPLLVVILGVAGAVFGAERVQEALLGQAGSLIGPEASASVGEMIENASTLGDGIGAKLAGLAALLFGATGAFSQLQKALNRAWEVAEAKSGGHPGDAPEAAALVRDGADHRVLAPRLAGAERRAHRPSATPPAASCRVASPAP